MVLIQIQTKIKQCGSHLSRLSRHAVSGASSVNFDNASEVFPYAMDSRYFPRRIKEISIALVSKFGKVAQLKKP